MEYNKNMTDESQKLSAKTRARAAEPINKIGFMDGATDGQKATFQSSFDYGYSQGLSFGMELGTQEAKYNFNNIEIPHGMKPSDARKLNCQVCLHSSTSQDNIVNLFNQQKESNNQYLQKLQAFER